MTDTDYDVKEYEHNTNQPTLVTVGEAGNYNSISTFYSERTDDQNTKRVILISVQYYIIQKSCITLCGYQQPYL